MGSKSQKKPKNLAPKLLQIRKALGLTQSEMLRRLGTGQSSQTARISEYESGARQPSFLTLLAYGRLAQIHVEILIDDEASFPDKLPGDFDFVHYKQELDASRRGANG